MKILHTVSSLSASGGGVSSAIVNLMNELQNLTNARLLTIGDGKGEFCQRDWCDIAVGSFSPFQFSTAFHNKLRSCNPDIFHIHGLWLYANHITASYARNLHKPYILTPHGMLHEKALRHSRIKKQLFGNLMFWKDIREASCIHVASEDEMLEVRKFGFTGPIAVIGNGIDCSRAIPSQKYDAEGKVLGYIGRLHPDKQIEKILYGLSMVSHPVKLKIAGVGSQEYTTFLKRETNRLGLDSKVEFVGFVEGRDKELFLANLSALLLPSRMESFGMVVIESLLAGVPVMASTNTPWSSLNEAGCGWWTDASPESIAEVISEIYTRNPSSLREMGIRGRKYVMDHYNSKTIASRMVQLYDWILSPVSMPKPDFIYDLP